MKPFRFAVQSYSAKSPDDWREQVRRAEANGYSAFHTSDHVLGPGPALSAMNHPVTDVAAFPAMAVAAEVTDTIRIGCRVVCNDYHNPVILAKEMATIDWFSDGRLELGIGAGWLQGEYEAIGIPFDPPGTRIDRMVETLGVLRACFAEGPVDVTGKHVHATGFEAVPKPVQQPGPPIMIGGGAKRVLGIAGREADIVSLNFDNSAGKIGPDGIGSSTAERTREKLDWIRAGAGDRFDDLEIEIGGYFSVLTDDRQATLEKMAPMLGLTPEQLAEYPHALIGSVDGICELLEERRADYGISYVTIGTSNADAFAPVVAKMTGT